MTCDEARRLAHPYADGELDAARSLEFEDHLGGCDACTREQAALGALSAALRSTATYYQAPAHLEERIRALARAAPGAPIRQGWRPVPFRWATVGIAAAMLVLMMLFVGSRLLRGHDADVLAREVVADHVRSLMVNHLTDVISSNQHTVKPWFEGKINFSPAVKDLTKAGFTLVGGRLDYLDDRPIAAIVYRRGAHFINLLLWPVNDTGDSAPVAMTQHGYNLVHWTSDGMTYWAVSSVNPADLRQFAADFRGAAAGGTPE